MDVIRRRAATPPRRGAETLAVGHRAGESSNRSSKGTHAGEADPSHAASSRELPCSLLGELYPPTPAGFERMLSAARNLLAFTYRRGMRQGFTSDAGWGCTLRSMQMLLGNALLRVCAGAMPASGAVSPDVWLRASARAIARECVDWSDASLGLPRVVLRGGHSRWYGPHEASHAFIHSVRGVRSRAAERAPDASAGSTVCVRAAVLACRDAAMYADEVERAAGCEPTAGGTWKWPVLALVPLRLGIREVNAAYIPSLIAAARMPAFAGAVGGTPRHSLYFPGIAPASCTRKPWQRSLAAWMGASHQHSDMLLCFDPHTVQANPLEPPSSAGTAAAASAHAPSDPSVNELPENIAVCSLPVSVATESDSVPSDDWEAFMESLAAPQSPRFMSPTALDPTISLAFLFSSAAEFAHFREQLAAINASLDAAQDAVQLPLFEVYDTTPELQDDDMLELSADADDMFAASAGASASAPDDTGDNRIASTVDDDSVTAMMASRPRSSVNGNDSSLRRDSVDAFVQVDTPVSDVHDAGRSPAARAPIVERAHEEDEADAPWYALSSKLTDLLMAMWPMSRATDAAAALDSTHPEPWETSTATPVAASRSTSAPQQRWAADMGANHATRRHSSSSMSSSHARDSSLTEVVWDSAAAASPEFRPVDASLLRGNSMDALVLPAAMESAS